MITLLAGLFPALRATRVPPIAAVREGFTLPKSRFHRFTPLSSRWASWRSRSSSLGYSMFRDDLDTASRLLSIAGRLLLLFVGVAMISSRAREPLACVVGWPARAIGGAAGRLARGNATRNPGRTAATAAALMIGIALVTFVAVLAEGMRASNRGAIEDQVSADYVVTAQDGFTPFVAAAGDEVAGLRDVGGRVERARRLGKVGDSLDLRDRDRPEHHPRDLHLRLEAGRRHRRPKARPEPGHRRRRLRRRQRPRRRRPISHPDALRRDARAAGRRVSTSRRRSTRSSAASRIAQETFDSYFERPRNQFTFVNVDGEPTDATTERSRPRSPASPTRSCRPAEAWIDKQDEDLNQFLNLLYVLLALSVIVSLFGMVNTLVLSVFERTRELGMLRAVGMTRRQVRRMIRHESVITALIGAALGLPLGIFLAALVTRALQQFDVRFSIPGPARRLRDRRRDRRRRSRRSCRPGARRSSTCSGAPVRVDRKPLLSTASAPLLRRRRPARP